MSSSDSVAAATENTSRLGYKHICVNYLHVACHDYKYLDTHTHTHPHTRPHREVTLPSLQVSLQVRLQVSQSLSLQVFSFLQLEF